MTLQAGLHDDPVVVGWQSDGQSGDEPASQATPHTVLSLQTDLLVAIYQPRKCCV
jgi:hypothetical protein